MSKKRRDTEIAEKDRQITNLKGWSTHKDQQITNLNREITYLNAEVAQLKAELKKFTTDAFHDFRQRINEVATDPSLEHRARVGCELNRSVKDHPGLTEWQRRYLIESIYVELLDMDLGGTP